MAHLEEDRELLERFRRGEGAALAEVYRAHAPAVARILQRGFEFQSGGRACRFQGTRTAFELEDRVQDVFARAFAPRARATYDGLTPYGAYLARIAKNLVIDDYRRKESALLAFVQEVPEATDDGPAERPSEPLGGLFAASGHPAEDAQRAELGTLVEAIVASLPDRERETYRLRFVEELEHAAIAARTAWSVSQVKTSEERIRKAFFREMRARGFLEGYVEEKRGWLRYLGPRRATR